MAQGRPTRSYTPDQLHARAVTAVAKHLSANGRTVLRQNKTHIEGVPDIITMKNNSVEAFTVTDGKIKLEKRVMESLTLKARSTVHMMGMHPTSISAANVAVVKNAQSTTPQIELHLESTPMQVTTQTSTERKSNSSGGFSLSSLAPGQDDIEGFDRDAVCKSCFVELPASGICTNCD